MDLVVVSGEKIAHSNKSQGVKQALQVVFLGILDMFFCFFEKTNLLGLGVYPLTTGVMSVGFTGVKYHIYY